MPDSRRRVLFLTNRMSDFTGSAVAALDLARELAARGHTMEIGCAVLSEPISALLAAESIAAFRLDRLISLRAFDLVWCQHLTLGWIDLEELAGESVPAAVLLAHLEPVEYLELPIYPLKREVASVIACTPGETEAAIFAALGVTRREVVFYNAAPRAFSAAARERSKLRRILCIPNHAVSDLTGTLDRLRAKPERDVANIGARTVVYWLVQAGDISWAGVAVIIGKSAVSALVRHAPIFDDGPHCGCDYIVEQNFRESIRLTAFPMRHREENLRRTLKPRPIVRLRGTWSYCSRSSWLHSPRGPRRSIAEA